MDPNEEDRKRRLYFKNLRKEQKRRRKERKREEEQRRQEQLRRERFQSLVEGIRSQVQTGEESKQDAKEGAISDAGVKRIPADNLTVHTEGNCTATTAERAERMVIGRRQVVSHSASVVAQQAPRSQVVVEKDNGLKEINPSNIKLLGKTIGKGTFGTCQLANYRDVLVVIKQFDGMSVERQKREVLHEAKVISQLGDHRGLQLLFGVQTETPPCSVVLKFHGHQNSSVTIYRAACKKLLNNEQWKSVVDSVGEALEHIHFKGYLHNDLKANNVVLEDRSQHYNPVIIDFGKSTKINKPKKKKTCMSKAEQRVYRQTYPHIAPEIVSGTRNASIASDVYSFAKLIQFLCDKDVLNVGAECEILKNLALSEDPDARPQLNALTKKVTFSRS